MTRNPSILGNATALVTSQVLTKAVNIAVSLMMVRWLGAEELGRYTFIIAFCFPFGAISDFGLAPLAIREISREPQHEGAVVAALRRLLFLLAGLAFFATAGVALLTQREAWALAGIALAALSSLVSSLAGPSLVVLTAREEMRWLSAHRVASSVVGSLATLGVLLAGGRALPLLAAAGGVNVLMLALARRLAGPPPPADPPRPAALWALFRQAVPFGLWMLGLALYYRIDMVMLQWLRGPRDVGLYAAAYRFLDSVIALAAALSSPFFPRIASLLGRDPARARELLEDSWRPLFALGLPLAIGTSLIADPLIRLLFGAGFSEAGPLLRILIWGGLPILCIHIPIHTLNAADRVWHLAGVFGISTVVNILANLILIPRWGAAGAGAATVCCEWLNLTLVAALIQRVFGRLPSAAGLWRYVLAASGMAGVMWLTASAGLAVEIAAGTAAYVGGLLALGYTRSADMLALRRLLAQ